MKLSTKQRFIINYVKQNGSITVDQCCGTPVNTFYHNSHKHCGEILSNMVKRGYLQREKKGIYVLGSLLGGFGAKQTEIFNPDQTKLL